MESSKEIELLAAFDKCFKDEYSLHEVYEDLVKQSIELYKTKRRLPNIAFLIMRDYKVEKYAVAVYPIIASNVQQLEINNKIMKRLIAEIQEASAKKHPDIQMVGVFRSAVGRMSIHNPKEVLKQDGSLDRSKVLRPNENPDAKDVLIFDIEEDFIKTTRMYEFIESSEGDIVVGNEPAIENKRGYDFRENNPMFGFVFTKGQAAVN